MTHTPGPWKAHFEEAYFVTGPDLGRVAMMMNLKGANGMRGRRSGEESAANCRLIAAAPDLLEAMRSLEPLLEAVTIGLGRVWIEADGSETDFGAALDAARAAIAKSTGEQA